MATVLVVEDERLSAEETAEIVRHAGHHIAGIASSGDTALALAERMRPDLALVDIGLRGTMDGITLADRLQTTFGIAVVYVTGQSSPSVLDRAKHTAPYGYVLKPFDERMLETSVEIALTRHRADRALREHGRWLSTLLRSMGVAIVATDDGGRVRFANPLAASLTGIDPLVGRPIDDCLKVIDTASDRHLDPAREALSAAAPLDFPPGSAVVRADGKRIPVDGSAAPVRDANGHVRGVALAFRDVSDRAEIERERQRAERLDALGTLAAGIAHDFNNMLVIIQNAAALGQRVIDDGPKASALFADVEAAAQRASSLTTQLMAFARGGTTTPRAALIEPLLKKNVSLALRGAATQSDFLLSADLWPVHADESQLAQVITNLVLNARQAMDDTGVIMITAKNRTIRPGEDHALAAGRYVEISFSDQGPGIPEDNLERIFDPYFTTRPTGTGLGLASAYGIVRHHRGSLRVLSRPGDGASFIVTLPASDELPAASERSSGGAPDPSRILIMDDEDEIRKVLTMCLVELGHRVEAVNDGESAVRAYEQALRGGDRFDLVVLDLTVRGGMGGIEALALLKRVDPHVRAVASSGYSDNSVLGAPEAYGFAGALPKPYSFTRLSNVLRATLGARQRVVS